jgi:hypothetical protein
MREKVEQFYQDLVSKLNLEKDFKSAALVLKVPDPTGEKPGASILSIERQGRIYNNRYFKGQLIKWGLPQEKVDSITSDFWNGLHQIDNRFLKDGIRHIAQKQFLPIKDLINKFGAIENEAIKVVERIRNAAEETF